MTSSIPSSTFPTAPPPWSPSSPPNTILPDEDSTGNTLTTVVPTTSTGSSSSSSNSNSNSNSNTPSSPNQDQPSFSDFLIVQTPAETSINTPTTPTTTSTTSTTTTSQSTFFPTSTKSTSTTSKGALGATNSLVTISSEKYPSPYVNQSKDKTKTILRKRYLNQYRKHHKHAIRSLAVIGKSNGIDQQTFLLQSEVDGLFDYNYTNSDHVDSLTNELMIDEEKGDGTMIELEERRTLTPSSTSINLRGGSPGSPSPSSTSPSLAAGPSSPSTEFNLPNFFPPPLTSKEKANLSPLPLPIVIPQRYAGNFRSRFVRAFAPSLLSAGIDESTWLSFLDCFSAALKASKFIRAIGMVGNIAAFTPALEAAATGILLRLAAEAAAITQTRAKADAFLSHANEVLFEPRGLVAIVVSTKFKDEILSKGSSSSSSCEPSAEVTEPLSLDSELGEEEGVALTTREPEVEIEWREKKKQEEDVEGGNNKDRNSLYTTYEDGSETDQTVSESQPDSQLDSQPLEHSRLGGEEWFQKAVEGSAPLEDHERPQDGPNVKSRFGRAINQATEKHHLRVKKREEKKEQKVEKELIKTKEKLEKEIELAELAGNQEEVERTQEKMKRRITKLESKKNSKIRERLWLVILNLTEEDKAVEEEDLTKKQQVREEEDSHSGSAFPVSELVSYPSYRSHTTTTTGTYNHPDASSTMAYNHSDDSSSTRGVFRWESS